MFEVKSTNGDTFLGGEDFDKRIMDYLADEFRKETGIDLRNDRLALQRLKDAAEKAKIELSSTTQTDVNLPFITADQNGPKHLNMKLTRAKLEALVDSLSENSRPAADSEGCRPAAVRNQRSGLVGGQTRMPKVRKRCKNCSEGSRTRGEPDEVVAIGAAIRLASSGRRRDVLLLTSRRCRSGSRRSEAS